MTTDQILSRAYAGESDLPSITDLQNACEAVDRLDGGTSVEELRSEFADPRLDAAHDLRLWQDIDGRLIGFGQLWILESAEKLDARLQFWVHPAARGSDPVAGWGQELDTQIIDWSAERLREAARERAKPARLATSAREDQADRLALLRNLGFAIDRYSFTMVRSLEQPIREPRPPEGFTLREVAGPHEAEKWVEMFNLSFIDHPNHHPWKAEQVLHYLAEPIYRQDLNLIVVAPDGTFAGFCWALINPEENARSGRSDGEIDLLGTRRGFRRIGIARALLLAGLQRLKQAGVTSTRLGVVANNPTGALQLYESAGFRALHTWILQGRDI